MPDVGDFAAMFTSFRVIAELTKLIINAHDAAVRREKGFELQEQIIATQDKIMAVQAAHATAIGRVGDLEKEVTELKAWDAKREKYKLAEMSPHTHVMGYALKEAAKSGEPAHFICANCFQDCVESILQPETHTSPLSQVLFSPRCVTEFYVTGGPRADQAVKRRPRPSR